MRVNVIEFLKTIYIGDRGCKSLVIDGWNSEVKMQVTSISRVRSKKWDFNISEDIEDGFIVFQDAKKISFEPSGYLPNDLINEIKAEIYESDYLITVWVDSVDENSVHTEVKIQIVANSIYLENPLNPNVRIVE